MTDETRDSQELPIHNIRKRNLTPLRKTAGDYYGFMNSSISSYEESFKFVLQGKTIADLIRTRPAPIVIDLMAPPGTVHDLLSEFPNGRGLAVSLLDHRVDRFIEPVQKSYKAENIKWLPEDITHPGT